MPDQPVITLNRILVTYHTTNNKDFDTDVRQWVTLSGYLLAYSTAPFAEEWPAGTSISVEIGGAKPTDWDLSEKGSLTIFIHSSCCDTWIFNVTLELFYTNAHLRRMTWEDIRMSESTPLVTLDWDERPENIREPLPLC